MSIQTIKDGEILTRETITKPSFNVEPARLRVREVATIRGMNVQELADAAGIAYNTALAYWRDSSQMVNKDILARIAVVLGSNVSDLWM